jgi:hypothetical protein
MKDNENIKKGILLISTLADALAEIECKTQEEVQLDLKKEGIDLNSSMLSLNKFLRLNSIGTEEKHKRLVKDTGTALNIGRKSIAEKITGWSKDKIISRINELSPEPDAVYSASYRNLEDKNLEDLSSLLKDLEIAIKKRKTGKK